MKGIKEHYRILMCLGLVMLYSLVYVVMSPGVMGIWFSGAMTSLIILWIGKYWREQRK